MLKFKYLIPVICLTVAGCTSTNHKNSQVKYNASQMKKIEALARTSHNSVKIIWVNPPEIEEK
jgi:hypothetical protein